MTDYRVYLIGKDGRFFDFRHVRAATDDAAFAQAVEICREDAECIGVEVWKGARAVQRHDREAAD